jgi:hypothetical protein
MYKALAFGLLLAACGGGNNGNGGDDDGSNTPPADARVYLDAPPSVPAMLTIGGLANENTQSGSTPLQGVAIALYHVGDDATPLATATSGADGRYSMMVPTNGHVVDAYLKASKSGYVDNNMYPAGPFQADTSNADANLITTGNYGLLTTFAGQQSGHGIVVVEILDASSQPVQGATIASTPPAGAYKYMDSNGIPTSTTSTNTDGAAFLINVPPGDITVAATKTGMTFKSHGLTAKADQFTTTVVTQ